jgi:GTP cyclohydrolase I
MGAPTDKNTHLHLADEEDGTPGPRDLRLAGVVRDMLREFGEDTEREGLVATPRRAAKAWRYLLQGYETDPESVLANAIFSEDTDEMICIRDIELYSIRASSPSFVGRPTWPHPLGKIVGFSKIAPGRRLRRRLQVRNAHHPDRRHHRSGPRAPSRW